MTNNYPWHQKNWQFLTRQPDLFTSALFLWGNKGLGQLAFAEKLSAWLLCENPKKYPEEVEACSECPSCCWLSAGTHPDRLILTPESGTSSIKVDAIREIRAFSEQKSHGGKHRVIIVSPAEAMNVSAANALLKILEEPFEDSIFLLVSYHLSWLLPTILSRCQKIYFPPLEPEDFRKIMLDQQCPSADIADLYALSHGAPLAFETSKEKQEIIQARKKIFTRMDSLKAKKLNPMEAAQSMNALIKTINFENALDILLDYTHQWVIQQKEAKAYTIYDKLLAMKQHLKKGMNLNQGIWLEELFLSFVYS